jgi:hypothetical protein
MRGVAPLLAAPLRAPLLLTALLTGLLGAEAPLADVPLADAPLAEGTRSSTPGDSMVATPLTDGRLAAPFTCATVPLLL